MEVVCKKFVSEIYIPDLSEVVRFGGNVRLILFPDMLPATPEFSLDLTCEFYSLWFPLLRS